MENTEKVMRFAASSTLVVAIVCTIPSILQVFTRRKEKANDGEYEDEDGKSRPEDVAKFSNRVPKFLALIFSVCGCVVSILSSVVESKSRQSREIGFFVDGLVYTASWVCPSP